ncbi:uncharacterized protein LOC110695487 [Chenopodium quinoa]|uniref:DUF7734 domain-containing protein n=1 Tax=Chenopodium quinoa TaxID=63459 RepID=A0A803MYQ2_CHEQI|nr:uncharacterized protein LOC110695487 [Chenopodium quinoa]
MQELNRTMFLNSINNLRPAIYSSLSNSTHLHGYKNIDSSYRNLICNLSFYKFKSDDNTSTPTCKTLCCRARRRVRYDEEDDESYGYNEEIAILEMYSQSARGEALLVTAMVDDQQVEVLIFKGFSSCLSYGTSPDPSKSVLPKRARIMLIDRIKGPFNPNNIEYIEKGLTWETFKSGFASTKN